MSLPKLPLRVAALLLASLLIVAVLGADPSEPADTGDDDTSAGRAMSTINDAIGEGSTKTGDGVGAAAWGSRGGAFLTARHVAFIQNYETMCCAVLIARQNGGAWRSKEAVKLRSIALFSQEDVLEVLDLIATPNSCSEPITLGRDSL